MEFVLVTYGLTALLAGWIDGPRLIAERSWKTWLIYLGIFAAGWALGIGALCDVTIESLFSFCEWILQPVSKWVFWTR